jgi:exosortase
MALSIFSNLTAMLWILIFLPIGFLWFHLTYSLRLEWITDPQYTYGLLVPWLVMGMILRRWRSYVTLNHSEPTSEGWKPWVILFAFLSFLYLPTRLIEAAIPEWRPIQWLLGIETIGLTLVFIRMSMGAGWFRQFVFPICFFLVAIPWPTPVEAPIIQNLTRVNTAAVIELLGWAGIPALPHGNVIEISTGMVGIEEACSGIRSLQTSLMACLFLGEFYRLAWARRLLLIPIGLATAMMFNVCRMFLLTLVAAKKGVSAISHYHDDTGITTAILCTLTLWGVVLLLRRRPDPQLSSSDAHENDKVLSPSGKNKTGPFLPSWVKLAKLRVLGLGLLLWLVMVETGVQTWYHTRESNVKQSQYWTLNFPQDNSTLKLIPIDSATRNLLQFDEGRNATWQESDGSHWQAFYFDWLPGRVAGYLAKRHTPEICLTAMGLKLISGPQLTMMKIHGVELPVDSYVFNSEEGPIQVFHCRWEAGAGSDDYVAQESTRFGLVRAVWAGRGNQGQKVLEFAIFGIKDPDQAKKALAHQLEKLIEVKKPATAV